MREQELEPERLYALALTLVTDSDAAGDIFMDARNEADLRRRAARWRRERGLPDAPPDVAPRSLTPDELENAQHLARRRRFRQRFRLGFAAFGAFVAMAVVVALLALSAQMGPSTGLRADPAFQHDAAARTRGADELVLAVYKAEKTPGAVTVWWALEGPGATDMAGKVRPELRPPTGWAIAPAATDTSVDRRNRVLYRTVFHATVPEPTAILALGGFGQDGQSNWQVSMDLIRVDDPAAREISLNKSVTLGIELEVRVFSVTVAPTYTLVRYRPVGQQYNLNLGHMITVMSGSTELERRPVWRRDDGTEEREIVYGPVPAGARELQVRFPRLVGQQYKTRTYQLPGAPVVKEWHRTGGELSGELVFAPGQDATHIRVDATDRQGKRHMITVQPGQPDAQNRPTVRLSAINLPPDDQLTQLIIDGLVTEEDTPSLVVKL